jgi:hypothetical protein
MSYDLGGGNVYIRLNGTTAWNHGDFQVEFNPAPPGRRSSEQFSSYSPWSVPNATYYLAALDPSQNYTMTLTNLRGNGVGNNPEAFSPSTITLWKGEPSWATANDTQAATVGEPEGDAKGDASGDNKGDTKGESKISAGAIAGGVVGGVLGAVLLATLVWLIRRRKDRLASSGRHTPIDIDSDAEYGPEPTPFMAQSSHPAGSATFSKLRSAFSKSGSTSDPGSSEYATTSAESESSTSHRPRQAADAGTMHVLGPDDDMIPPSYNPEWESSSMALLARNGALPTPPMPEGAGQRPSTPRQKPPTEVDAIKSLFTRRKE